MAGECERVGSFKGIFRTVQIWRGKPDDILSASQTKLSEQRQAGNIRKVVEIVAVDLG
jgi:hypothetical protein